MPGEQEGSPAGDGGRIRLDVSFLGRDFQGWQRQPGGRTVQGELEGALLRVFGREVPVTSAGRTDAGVHARHQVCHLDLPRPFPEAGLLRALNALTPRSLRVAAARRVEPDFHARYSPHRKTYRYRFDLADWADPFELDTACHAPGLRPDAARVREFLATVAGTHDFASFCSADNSTRSTVRTLEAAAWEEPAPDKAALVLAGNGFLQHMVRILAGTALEVGRGRLGLDRVREALGRRDGRDLLGPTLPAHGLTLERVEYLDEWGWKQG